AEEAVIAHAHGANPSLHRLPGSQSDFERLGLIFDLPHHRFATSIRLHDHDELRCRTESGFSKGSGVMREGLGLRGDPELAPVRIRSGIWRSMQTAADQIMSPFDDEWRGCIITSGQAG